MRARDLFGPQVVEFKLPVAWGTAATVSEEVSFRAPHPLRINDVRFTPDSAITGNATNFATLRVRNKGLAGTGTTVMATLAFDTPTTDDVAAFDEKAIPVSATSANRNAVEGDVIAVEKTVGGTGLAIDGVLTVEYVSGP